MNPMKKHIAISLLFMLCMINLFSAVKIKVLSFDNPGNRRLLKNDRGSYYFYRSLPEKSMKINTAGVDKIQIRSFGIESIRKPQVIAIIHKSKTTYDLSLKERLNGYYLYNDLEIDVPSGTNSIEILCYNRSIYLRAFQLITVVPKPKVVKIPNIVMKAHAGMIDVIHNSTASEYYTFNEMQALRISLNNARNAVIYVRARLTDRSLPIFALYHNGRKVNSYEFSLKRTTKYKAQGVNHLTIGMKIELPPNSDSSEYELRAESDHLFMARPVVLKK